VLGLLLGLVAQGIYDLFKAWLTPILLEGRPLKYEEAMATLIPAIAAGLSVLILLVLFYRWGLLKQKKFESTAYQ